MSSRILFGVVYCMTVLKERVSKSMKSRFRLVCVASFHSSVNINMQVGIHVYIGTGMYKMLRFRVKLKGWSGLETY